MKYLSLQSTTWCQKELQNSDLIYVNLMTDVFKIIVKYRQKIIAKYHHFSPSGNRALESLAGCRTMFLFAVFCKIGALERNAY